MCFKRKDGGLDKCLNCSCGTSGAEHSMRKGPGFYRDDRTGKITGYPYVCMNHNCTYKEDRKT